jgi:RNA polymerase sigma factor (sigma-70 family)
MTDEQLIALYERAWAFLPFYSSRYGRDAAEEIIASAVLAVIMSVRRSRIEPAHPDSYLAGTLRNRLCVELRHRNQTAAVDPEGLRLVDPDPTPEQQAIDRDLRIHAIRARQDLDERSLEVIESAYIREEPKEKTQEEMGLSVTTYRQTKSRAKAKLAKKMLDEIFSSKPTQIA